MQKYFIVSLILAQLLFCAQIVRADSAQEAFKRNRLINSSLDNVKLKKKIVDKKLIKWIQRNVCPETRMPFSFQIPQEDKKRVYEEIGESFSVDAIIERVIVEEGLVVYDGAVRQILLTMVGGGANLDDAYRSSEVFWNGSLGQLMNLRAGYEQSGFVYNLKSPAAVTSDLTQEGKRGFVFRIINAKGRYNTSDPLDGKTYVENFPTWPTIHWEDWKPIAGENAWVAMAALHLYHKKYFDESSKSYRHNKDSIELKLAEELARAAMLLQAHNGGVRMAPIGTYMSEDDNGRGWYNLISTENNLSWYAAFRMLYQVTGKSAYRKAVKDVERYFKVVWNNEEEIFDQGMRYVDGRWQPERKDFATDVQTWGILVLGCKKLDSWFGEGASYKMWDVAKEKAGSYDNQGQLLGVGFTVESDRVSVEWTAGAIFAAREVAVYYQRSHPEWAFNSEIDAQQMRDGIELLRKDLPGGQSAYSYSSRRGWIPFGWFSHNKSVLSLASTAWVALLDAQFNPFYLSGQDSGDDNAELVSAAEMY